MPREIERRAFLRGAIGLGTIGLLRKLPPPPSEFTKPEHAPSAERASSAEIRKSVSAIGTDTLFAYFDTHIGPFKNAVVKQVTQNKKRDAFKISLSGRFPDSAVYNRTKEPVTNGSITILLSSDHYKSFKNLLRTHASNPDRQEVRDKVAKMAEGVIKISTTYFNGSAIETNHTIERTARGWKYDVNNNLFAVTDPRDAQREDVSFTNQRLENARGAAWMILHYLRIGNENVFGNSAGL